MAVTQARSKANLVGASAAETLAQDEVLTVNFNRDATDNDPVIRNLTVNLTTGQTKAQQLETINQAFEDRGFELKALLDDTDKIVIEATEFGDDYAVDIISDIAAGAGTSGIGNVLLAGQGTDLKGTIITEATVVNGNQLKAGTGFDAEGIKVEIPMMLRVLLVQSVS